MEAASLDRQKALGAYYTPRPMADKLVQWAVRTPDAKVLDPSFGGLVFIESAAQRLAALGASEAKVRDQVWGVDLDDEALARLGADERSQYDPSRFLHRDFFDVRPGVDLPLFESVVGNPPYVRYQGWNGTRARELSMAAGVRLTRMASSWAPFVIHATSFVSEGGRLAMVLPAEMLHAQYATQVLDFLRASYSRVQAVMFEQRVFPGALEEVVLLCAQGRGQGPGELELIEVENVADFAPDRLDSATAQTVLVEGVPELTLLAQLLDQDCRTLYQSLGVRPDVTRLGDIASVDIGAVTGANKFFLLDEATRGTLPEGFTTACISKAAHIPGVRLKPSDLDELRGRGAKLNLFAPPRQSEQSLPAAAQELVARGEEEGLHERYKCRVRNPWWRVPLPSGPPPDLFLTYCSNQHPRLVANDAGARNTNTVHGVTLTSHAVVPGMLACAFLNSLTWLSAELVGRSYGGGVLKLEPSEAEAVLIPALDAASSLDCERIETLIRVGDIAEARQVADRELLVNGLGLDHAEVALLRAGALKLSSRRRTRGQAPSV